MLKKINYLYLFITIFLAGNVQAALPPYTEQGQGIPLVLIHAFPTDQRLWQPQLAGLSPYFRVITIDLAGFGKARETNGQAVTMQEYADEVKQVLTHLGIQKAIIGGESMGGYITLAFLQSYPENVEGLILSDTQAIADSPESKIKRETAAIDTLKMGTAKVISAFMPVALSPHASDVTRRFLFQIVNAQTPVAIASALRGMALRQDTSDVLQKTTLPILILTGDKDTVILPKQSEAMHALAKNSKLVVIKDAGHLASLEQPKAWNEAVKEMFYKAHH